MNNQDKSQKLYNAITNIDDDLIEEAEGKTSGANKNMVKGILSLVACAAVFVLLCFPLSTVFNKTSGSKNNDAANESVQENIDESINENLQSANSNSSMASKDEQDEQSVVMEVEFSQEKYNNHTITLNHYDGNAIDDGEELTDDMFSLMRTSKIDDKNMYFVIVKEKCIKVYDAKTYEVLAEGDSPSIDSVASKLGIVG